MRTKLTDCYVSCLSENFDVIIFVETWLHPDIDDSEFIDNRYVVYRNDRSSNNSEKSIGGGVLIAVRKNLLSSKLYIPSSVEDIWIRLQVNSRFFIFSAVYLPPDVSLAVYADYVGNLKTICYNNLADTIFVLGDFNLPGIQWIQDDETIGLTPTNIKSEKETLICYNFASCDLCQFNNIANCNNNILDLCFSNCDSLTVSRTGEFVKVDKFHAAQYF